MGVKRGREKGNFKTGKKRAWPDVLRCRAGQPPVRSVFPKVAPGAQPGRGSEPEGGGDSGVAGVMVGAGGGKPKKGGKPTGYWGKVRPRASAPLRPDGGSGSQSGVPRSVTHPTAGSPRDVLGAFGADREVEGGKFAVPAPPGVAALGPRGKDPPRCRGRGRGKRLGPGQEGRSRGERARSL